MTKPNQNHVTHHEAARHFGISPNTLYTLKRCFKNDYPAVAGVLGQKHLYDLAELEIFFQNHAPQYLAATQRRADAIEARVAAEAYAAAWREKKGAAE